MYTTSNNIRGCFPHTDEQTQRDEATCLKSHRASKILSSSLNPGLSYSEAWNFHYVIPKYEVNTAVISVTSGPGSSERQYKRDNT